MRGGPVEHGAEVVVVALLRGTGVQAHSARETNGLSPSRGPECALCVRGGRRGIRSRTERRAEGVAGHGEDVSVVLVDERSQDSVVLFERRRHRVRVALPAGGRALEVREQEGHRAARSSPHARKGCQEADVPARRSCWSATTNAHASANAVSTCQPAWACNTLSASHSGPPVRPKSWSGTATANRADRACAEDRLLARALPDATGGERDDNSEHEDRRVVQHVRDRPSEPVVGEAADAGRDEGAALHPVVPPYVDAGRDVGEARDRVDRFVEQTVVQTLTVRHAYTVVRRAGSVICTREEMPAQPEPRGDHHCSPERRAHDEGERVVDRRAPRASARISWTSIASRITT